MPKRSSHSKSKKSSAPKKRTVSVVDSTGAMKLVQVGGSKKRTKGSLKSGCPMPLGGGCENIEKVTKKLKVCKPNTHFKLRVFLENNGTFLPASATNTNNKVDDLKGVSIKPEMFGFSVQVRHVEKKKGGVSKIKPELLLCPKQEADLSVVSSALHKLLNQKFLDCLFHPQSDNFGKLFSGDNAGAKKIAALLKLHRMITGPQKVISSSGEIKSLLKKVLHRMVCSKQQFSNISSVHLRFLAYSAYAPMKVCLQDAYFIGWEDSLIIMAVVFKKLFDKHLPKICQLFEHKCS